MDLLNVHNHQCDSLSEPRPEHIAAVELVDHRVDHVTAMLDEAVLV